MELKFTPGPWAISRTGVVVGGVIRQYANGSAQDQLFMACVVDDDNQGSQAGNTQAIAALPDLAAALLAILAEVTPGHAPFSADSYLPAHLIEQARAALEKAGAV